MHTHPNAWLTPLGRKRLLRRHIDDGESLAFLAAQSAISVRTAYKWLVRYRSAGPTALVDRRSGRRTLDALITALVNNAVEFAFQVSHIIQQLVFVAVVVSVVKADEPPGVDAMELIVDEALDIAIQLLRLPALLLMY